MSRFRWYHYYFPLAVFNVIVIVLSLRLHQQGFDHFQDLIDAQRRLDTEATCLQAAQKAIMELNAPGNDLFGVRNRADYEKQRKRYEVANRNMAAVLSQMRGLSLDETRIAAQVEGMKSKAERLFAIFRPLVWGFETESSDGVSARSVMANIKSIGPSAIRRYALGVVGDLYAGLLMSLSAGPAMRDMDSHQHEALHAIATLSNKNAQRRLDLIEGQQADLGRQFRSQSFLIAGVLVILVGVLFFGRRLQEADKALALERERVKEARRERLAAIGELCSSVAHGIRNPLAAIRSSAQLALELGQLDGGTRERIQDILDEGGRL
ncbi:MAG TPA: hypothetical protein P5081_13335, partial [Phycisphaerae bacterium]|nr:hypothetical protein [Phycisphaerae bacterium]